MIAAEARRGSFPPFFMTVDGTLEHEATLFLRRLAEKLSAVRENSYAKVFRCIRV